MELVRNTRQSNRKFTEWLQRHGKGLAFVSALLVILLWDAVTRWGSLPAFILPPPGMVLQRFISTTLDGTLWRHASATLLEIVLGLLAGVFAATILGYLLAKSPTLERILSPYLVASQAIPIVAIAPLLIIWFRPGLFSKVLIASLIVFFPVLVNTVVGVRAVPQDLRDLMRSLRASRWQTLRFLEIPAALPVFLGGLRIGATLSVIGAVVGELIGANRGLGFLIGIGRGQYDTSLVFVAVITLVVMALSLYGIVILLEKKFLSWQHESRKGTLVEKE